MTSSKQRNQPRKRKTAAKKPSPPAEEPRPNPYLRLLQKLDAANGRVQAAEEKDSGQR
jgi:hypothetical protein